MPGIVAKYLRNIYELFCEITVFHDDWDGDTCLQEIVQDIFYLTTPSENIYKQWNW